MGTNGLSSFAVLSYAGITTTGGGTITGNIGATPIAGSGIGVPQSQVVGTIYETVAGGPAGAVVNPTLLTAVMGDLAIAYNDAAGRTPIPTGTYLNPGVSYSTGYDMGGKTLVAGLYKFTSDAYIESDVTLTGSATDVWIFQLSAQLIVANNVHVILAGGARADHVYWQVGTQATIGTGASFKGTIMAQTAVVMNSTSAIEGSAFSVTAGVVFNGASLSINNNPSPAQIVSPVNGSTNSSSTVTFTWNAGVGASQYQLYVGSALGGGDLYLVGASTNLSATVSLPATGGLVYARLYSLSKSAWPSTDTR